MLRKMSKTLIILLVVLMMVSANIYIANASKAGELITTLDQGNSSNANTKVQSVVATVVVVARVIGVAVAIVMLLAVAMKYMSAAPGEKADIKKHAVVYVVGAVVLFAVSGILGIINSFSSNIK